MVHSSISPQERVFIFCISLHGIYKLNSLFSSVRRATSNRSKPGSAEAARRGQGLQRVAQAADDEFRIRPAVDLLRHQCWRFLRHIHPSEQTGARAFSSKCRTVLEYNVSYLRIKLTNNKFQSASEDAGRIGLTIVLAGTVGSVVCGVALDKTHKFK